MIEDFSIQFSQLYLPMKYLVIISRHSVYISTVRIMNNIDCIRKRRSDASDLTLNVK